MESVQTVLFEMFCVGFLLVDDIQSALRSKPVQKRFRLLKQQIEC